MNLLYRKLAPLIANWRTTLAGLPLMLGGLTMVVNNLVAIANGESPTLEAWQAAIGSILAGVGLVVGKDATVSGVPGKTPPQP